MAEEGKMVSTEEQCNALEEPFAEMLRWMVVISVNSSAIWKTYAILKLPNLGYLEGSRVSSIPVCRKALMILYLLLKTCLMNADWLTPAILHLVLSQRHSSTTFLNNQEMSLFDHIHLGHENQGVLYKYLESDFHIS